MPPLKSVDSALESLLEEDYSFERAYGGGGGLGTFSGGMPGPGGGGGNHTASSSLQQSPNGLFVVNFNWNLPIYL